MKSQLKAGAVLSYIALFLNSILSIFYTPVMLKLLGQSEYGLYSLATSAAGYIGILNFGLGNAVIRYVARYKALKDEEGCSNLYGMFCVMYGILGVIALIVGSILTLDSHLIFSKSLSLEEMYKLKILMGISVLNLSIGIGLGAFSVIVLAHERFIFQKTIVVLSSIINPLIMLPLLLIGYKSISLVIVSTLLNFVTIIINMYYCFYVIKIKISFKKVDNNLVKEIVIFSFYIFLNLIIGQLYWSTDQVILGIYSGTVAVSIYSIGASFSGYFSGFSSSISNVFLSKVSRMVTKEDSDYEVSDLFIRVGRIQYIIISFALSGFILFGQEFINLWLGKDYVVSYWIAVMVLAPMAVSLIQGMGGIILQAKNMQKFKSIVNVIIAILNVFASILFVQWWGVIGCALATALAYTLGNIIIINIYYWKKINIDIPRFWSNILRMSLPLIISLVFGIAINKLVIADNWIFFLIKTIIFTGFYNLLMWITGMNKAEKNLILTPFKNIMYRCKKKLLYRVG